MPGDEEGIRERFLAIETRSDLADILEVSEHLLVWHAFRSDPTKRYTRFTVPKKGGGERLILAPNPGLKLLQRRLNDVLQNVYVPRHAACGFTRGRHIRMNAERHVARRWVFNVDLEDFFPSINFGRVRGLFLAKPYQLPQRVATILAQLCCYENQLPQGAPTSPVVSNMICRGLDYELTQLARQHRCMYSRYADDITFSSLAPTFPSPIAVAELEEYGGQAVPGEGLETIISKHGFKINSHKVRLQRRNRRQEVTGLVVNRRVNLPRSFIREIRAMLHAWERYGLVAAQTTFEAKYYNSDARGSFMHVPSYQEVLAGKLAHLRFIRGATDDVYIKYFTWFKRLNPRQ